MTKKPHKKATGSLVGQVLAHLLGNIFENLPILLHSCSCGFGWFISTHISSPSNKKSVISYGVFLIGVATGFSDVNSPNPCSNKPFGRGVPVFWIFSLGDHWPKPWFNGFNGMPQVIGKMVVLVVPFWLVLSMIFYFHPEPWGNDPILIQMGGSTTNYCSLGMGAPFLINPIYTLLRILFRLLRWIMLFLMTSTPWTTRPNRRP